VLQRRGLLRGGHRVARHGDSQLLTHRVHAREDGTQTLGGSQRLGLAAVQTVGVLEERLPHRVGERHAAAVHQCEVLVPPPMGDDPGQGERQTDGFTTNVELSVCTVLVELVGRVPYCPAAPPPIPEGERGARVCVCVCVCVCC